MINWKNATLSDQHLFTAIARLFSNNPQLLNFFFHESEPKLSHPCSKIKQLSSGLSSADELLVRIALDIWSESGCINFNEIYQKLDDHNFSNLIITLGYLRGDRSLSDFGQLKLDTLPGNSGQLKTDIF